MKIIGVILFLAVSLSWLPAQTNGPSVRPLSLQDCFAEALKHNFDVQVEQLNPEISLYNLKSAYAGYDPIFTLSGEHRYNDSGSVFQNGQQVAGSEYNEQLYSSGFSGGTPWGMTYDLGGNVSRTTGINSLTNGISSGQVGALTLTQPLLKNFWIDDTRLTIRLNKNRLKFSEQGLREQIITTVTAVENAYY